MESQQRGNDIDVTDVRKVWSEVLARVQQRRRTTQILLESASVVAVDGGSLQLSMPHAGMARRVIEGANADLLRGALNEVLGVDWTIKCTVGGAADGGQAERGSAARGSAPVIAKSDGPARSAAGARDDAGIRDDAAENRSAGGSSGAIADQRVTRPDSGAQPGPGSRPEPARRNGSGAPAGRGEPVDLPEPPPEEDFEEIPDDYGDPDFAASSTPHDPEQAAVDLLAAELGGRRMTQDD